MWQFIGGLSMLADSDILKKEYDSRKSLYECLAYEMTIQLKELLKQRDIELAFPIESRVKSWDSIHNKCLRNQLSPKNLENINDITGIRIIVLFHRDLDIVCKIISENFDVDRMENTAERLTDNQFGYGSIHFEVMPKETWCKVPTMRQLANLKAEIQVRTATQHIWAAASHLLQYKRESHVPIPLRRSINRVSALLETVDLEFERVLEQRKEYAVESSIQNSEPLNADILAIVLNRVLPIANKEDSEDYAKLLDELNELHINSKEQLLSMVKSHLANTLELDKQRAYRITMDGSEYDEDERIRAQKGVFYTHVGLVRDIMRKEFGKRYIQPQVYSN